MCFLNSVSFCQSISDQVKMKLFFIAVVLAVSLVQVKSNSLSTNSDCNAFWSDNDVSEGCLDFVAQIKNTVAKLLSRYRQLSDHTFECQLQVKETFDKAIEMIELELHENSEKLIDDRLKMVDSLRDKILKEKEILKVWEKIVSARLIYSISTSTKKHTFFASAIFEFGYTTRKWFKFKY